MKIFTACGMNSQAGATPIQAKWIKLDLDNYHSTIVDQICSHNILTQNAKELKLQLGAMKAFISHVPVPLGYITLSSI